MAAQIPWAGPDSSGRGEPHSLGGAGEPWAALWSANLGSTKVDIQISVMKLSVSKSQFKILVPNRFPKLFLEKAFIESCFHLNHRRHLLQQEKQEPHTNDIESHTTPQEKQEPHTNDIKGTEVSTRRPSETVSDLVALSLSLSLSLPFSLSRVGVFVDGPVLLASSPAGG